MLLVVFGAGASFDSAPRLLPSIRPTPENKWRPPLTDGLFADREGFREILSDVPQILPIAVRLGATSPQRSLEEMLSALEAEAVEYPARYSELAAVRYYIQVLLWECERHWHRSTRASTNYLGLLDRIQRWRRGNHNTVAFATFNYDRLFEYAASFYISDGNKIYENVYDSMSSYIEQAQFPIVKLHGSLDWGFRVNSHLEIVEKSGGHVWQIMAEVIRRFPSLSISSELAKIIERPPQPQEGHAFVPAMAIPTNRKSSFTCPESHLQFLSDALPRVTAILVVGWRGMEDHFLRMLGAGLPMSVKALAACGSESDSRATLGRLSNAIKGLVPHEFPGGFSELVLSSELDTFLANA